MFNFKIEKTLEVGKNGGETLFFYDINGDGQKEMFFRQSAGQQLASKFFKDTKWHGYVTDENQNLLQLTCMTQNGTIIWQKGSPWPHEKPYKCHCGSQLGVRDIDGDGQVELVYLFKDRLYILDAGDGSPVDDVGLPTEAFSILQFQKTECDTWNMVLKCVANSEYGYGQPIMVLDSELNTLWRIDELNGAGHNFLLMDVDDDGLDELFAGYNLLDHDGEVIWSFDFPSHADQIQVADINEDGIDEVIYCTDNEDFIVVNVKGDFVFKKSGFLHPQNTSVGRFMDDIPGLQLFMCNRETHGGAVMMDCEGTVLWEFPCNGSARTLTIDGRDYILFFPSPGALPEDLLEECKKRADELGYTDLPLDENCRFEPFVISGEGEIVYRFPELDMETDFSKWNIRSDLKYDHGAGYSLIIEDIDGDGQDEFVFYNRHKVWFLKRE